MRKDVKVGLAVGGILFGVVLAYALFFTGDNKDKRQQTADRGKPAPTSQPAVEPAPSRDSDTAPRPGRVEIVSPDPAWGQTPIARVPTPGNDGMLPANPPPASPTPTDWRNLLDGAPALGQTSTPSTPTPLPGHDSAVVVPPVVPPTTPSDSIVPPPAIDGPKSYVVQQGDNYWKISQAEYGSGQYVAALMRANPRYPATKLRQGVTIVIPPKSEVVPSGAPIASAAGTPTTRPVDATTQYRVKSGDNLYIISKRLYGRADKAERIYELNKELIGPNPNALKLGTLLQLPEPPAGTTVNTTAASASGSDIETEDVAQ